MISFKKWYSRLLRCAMYNNSYENPHPLDSCLERDVLRDGEVRKAMEKAFNRIFSETERE